MPRWLRSHMNANLRFVSVQHFQRSPFLLHELFTRDINLHVLYVTGQQLATASLRWGTHSNGTRPDNTTIANEQQTNQLTRKLCALVL